MQSMSLIFSLSMAAVMVALSQTEYAYEAPTFVGCDATSLGNWFLMFHDSVVVIIRG
jgi:hypothetical protein